MAASTTPGMVPEPPRMLTPPSTAMVTTSSSQPAAMVWRVEPRREVRQTAAKPLISAGQQEEDELGALNRDAGELRREGVVADGVDPPSEGGPVQQDAEGEGEDHEGHHLEGDDLETGNRRPP